MTFLPGFHDPVGVSLCRGGYQGIVIEGIVSLTGAVGIDTATRSAPVGALSAVMGLKVVRQTAITSTRGRRKVLEIFTSLLYPKRPISTPAHFLTDIR
jgi:hypothetical protein